jgi:hypothetical protein
MTFFVVAAACFPTRPSNIPILNSEGLVFIGSALYRLQPLEALRPGMKRDFMVVEDEEEYGQVIVSLAAMEVCKSESSRSGRSGWRWTWVCSFLCPGSWAPEQDKFGALIPSCC